MTDHFAKDFAIQRTYIEEKDDMKRPSSDCLYGIYYVLKGQRVCFLNGDVTVLSQGELMFSNAGDLHATASSEVAECESIVLNFSHDFVNGCDAELAAYLPLIKSRFIRLTAPEQAAFERVLFTMLEESEAQPSFYMSYLRALLSELLIMIHRAEQLAISLTLERQPMHQKISEITLYMSRRYEQPLTLEQIAVEFAISPSYLSRTFKKLTGFHFKEYLQVLRIREAQKRLRTTKESVHAISLQVGFEHIAHFNKTFKKLTGTTPLRYRKARQ